MPTITELLSHTAVRAAIGAVAVILAASVAYYLIESRPPAYAFATAAVGNVTDDVTGTGAVTPVQNPDLAFTAGGRVTSVNVKVGDTAYQGELLASLDTGILGANLASAQANLAGVINGPRAVDLAGKQTAVDQAQQTLSNAFSSLPATLANGISTAEEAVRTDADPLILGMNSATHPRVSFTTNNDAAADKAGMERGTLKDTFDFFDAQSAALNTATPAQLEAAVDDALARLAVERQFFADLSDAANSATPALDGSSLAAISTGRATVNNLIVTLTSVKQGIQNDKLAVQSAQDALALAKAGATPEARQAAQAQVDSAAAQLRQSQIIAPFSGTVASVAVKAGDVVAPNTNAVALIPSGNFEVDIYLSEIDVTKVHQGDVADVTLDAYGASNVFPATVGSVDAAPTPVNGVPSYKATLVFAQADARIASGMHANATVHAAAKTGVLTIPAAAVANDANGAYVMKKEGNNVVKAPVTVGIRGTENVEITGGLGVGDQVALVTGQ